MPDDSTQKKRVAKQPADHPKYADMIRAAIVALKERNGSSRQAIEKYIKANYKVGHKASQSIKAALKRGASTGYFIHTSGVGASGSFKVNKEEKQKKAAKVAVPAKKNPAEKPAKTSKKPAVQKPAKKAKKSAVKKVPANEKSGVKSAQKAKESSPKKTSSAKKQTSSVPEKSPVKKPSAKNSKATKTANKKPARKRVTRSEML